MELILEIDFDIDLSIDEFEVEDFMNKFFEKFNVEWGNFRIEIYFFNYFFLWYLFKKMEFVFVLDFIISMLIELVKVGKWLYD